MFKDLEDSLGAVKNIMTALILVGVVVLVWKAFGLGTPKLSTSGMYSQGVRYLDGQLTSTGQSGMLGANEPPVFFATAVDPEQLNQAAEAGLEADGKTSYDPRLDNAASWGSTRAAAGGVNWQYDSNRVIAPRTTGVSATMEGFKYGRRSGMETRLDAAAAGASIELL